MYVFLADIVSKPVVYTMPVRTAPLWTGNRDNGSDSYIRDTDDMDKSSETSYLSNDECSRDDTNRRSERSRNTLQGAKP
jgi:hypothetical protein